MAEDIGALVVRIETDLKNFNNGINQVGEKVNTLGSTIKKVGGLIAGAFAVKAVVGGIKDLTDAAKESERAGNRLQTLAMNVPGTTQAQIDALRKLAGEIQNLTVIEDDAMIAGQSQLATFQLSTNTIAKLSPAFADLAVATYGANVSQEQMIQSGNLIGKVMMGNVGALSRVGVSFTAAQEEILKTGTEAQKTAALVEVLGQNFGGLAESTRSTTEGAIIAMNNAWGDMKEVLGGFLLPILGQVATWFSSQIPIIQSTAESAFTKIGAAIKITSDAVNTLTNFFTTYWGILQPILLGITAGAATFGLYTLAINAAAIATTIWTTVTGIATTVGAAFAAVLAFITSPIGIVVIAIAALVAAGVALYKNWDTVKAKALELWGNISGFLDTTAGKITAVLLGPIGAGLLIIKNWDTIKDKAKEVFGYIKTFIGDVLDGITGSFRVFINATISAFNTMIRGLNRLKMDIPDWVPKIGGGKLGFNIPEIPKLAKGTNFVPFDTAAFLHKGEAVIPAKNNPANPGAGSPVGRGDVIVNISIGGSVVGRNGMKELRDMISQGISKEFGYSIGGTF